VEKVHDADLHCVDWNPHDENLILTGSADNSVRMFDRWNLTSGGVGSPIYKFEGHKAAALCVQWSPDKAIVFGSSIEDGLLNAWDYKKVCQFYDILVMLLYPIDFDISISIYLLVILGASFFRASLEKTYSQYHMKRFPLYFSVFRDKVVDFHWKTFDPWTIINVSEDSESTGGGGTLQAGTWEERNINSWAITIIKLYGVENYTASGVAYFFASSSRLCFFDLNSAGRPWNNNVIWVNGDCLQRDDEEPMKLMFRAVKQYKCTNGSKKKGTDRERRVNSPEAPGVDYTVLPETTISSKLAQMFPKKQMLNHPLTSSTTGSGKVAEKPKRRRVKPYEKSGVKTVEDRPAIKYDWKVVEEKARVEEEKADLRKMKVELERNVTRLKADMSKEGKRLEALKASQVVEINNLKAEARVNFEEVVAERDRLVHHLMSKGYSEDEVDAIRADTYVEEEDEEVEDDVAGVVDGLDGVPSQTVKDNQEDENEHLEGENVKECEDLRPRLKDLVTELAKERYTSVSLLSS
ncbi:hypothetical protein GIB67_034053, partial [Kingdonia uniflora]